MKRCFFVSLVIGGAAFATGCATAQNPGTLSMKGYELYSWPAGQDWDFALMVGTNRLKTLDEIQSPAQTLHGVEAIKTALRALPVGEQVFWEGAGWTRQSQAPAGSVTLPPEAIRDEIAGLCSQLGIVLTVNE